jgi:hypothetical protein
MLPREVPSVRYREPRCLRQRRTAASMGFCCPVESFSLTVGLCSERSTTLVGCDRLGKSRIAVFSAHPKRHAGRPGEIGWCSASRDLAELPPCRRNSVQAALSALCKENLRLQRVLSASEAPRPCLPQKLFDNNDQMAESPILVEGRRARGALDETVNTPSARNPRAYYTGRKPELRTSCGSV